MKTTPVLRAGIKDPLGVMQATVLRLCLALGRLATRDLCSRNEGCLGSGPCSKRPRD